MYRIVTLVAVFFFLAPSTFAQTTRYVTTSGEDTTDCTDEASPCATLTYAIDQASDGDTIQIADGEYTESFAIEKSLSLHGESEDGTIIQAHEEPGQAASRVITIDTTGVGELQVEITDLTIRHGNATGDFPDTQGGGIYSNGTALTLNLTNITFSNNKAVSLGGGMTNIGGSSPTLSNVIFSNNEAQFGGGIANGSGSSPTLTNVSFINNAAQGEGLPSGGGMYNVFSSPTLTDVTFSGNSAGEQGGGMLNWESSPTLINVTFSDNEAKFGGGMITFQDSSPTLTNVTFIGNLAESGGGMFNILNPSPITLTDVAFIGNSAWQTSDFHGGGGMYNDRSSPRLTNVIFSENTAANSGGGMYNLTNSSPTLTNVTFSGNSASGTTQETDGGGGLYNRITSSPALTNVVFTGNTATGNGGGGMFNLTDSSPTLTNVSFSGNNALSGGGIYSDSSSVSLINTIMWGNFADSGNEIYNDDDSSIELMYSLYGDEEGDIVEGGGFQAENSWTDDPLFLDAESGNLRLMENSPAIDTGDPVTPDSIFATDENGNPIDLAGDPRFFNDMIDIGTYENQGSVANEASPGETAEILSLPSPNPVSETATFTLAVEHGQNVSVEVFDVMGRHVQTVYEGALAAGMSERLTLDASALPTGVYMIRATGEDFTRTRRVTVVR